MTKIPRQSGRLLFGVALLLFVDKLDASFCGRAGVPYSFEVLPSGAPVLGCAQPSCVAAPAFAATGAAHDESGQPKEDSEFLTDVNGQPDGFFRDGDRSAKHYRHQDAPKLIANCSGGFNELSCPKKNQWIGGIEYIDHPRQPLILQCCTFSGLRFSQEVGSTTVGPGEAITGGEVIRNGRQISFDVIANVKKVVKDGKIGYEVTVRRMNCLPDPPEPEVQFEEDVPSEVYKILSSAANKDLGTAEKFEKKESPLKTEKKTKATETIQNTHSATIGEAQPQQPQLQPISPPAEPFQPSSIQTGPAAQTGPTSVGQLSGQPGQPQTAFAGFPTLPTHTFPTFPTLPPHTFPTFAPHTFPVHTLPPGFPTFAPLPAFSGQQSQPALAFAAPSASANGGESAPLAPLPALSETNSIAPVNEPSQLIPEQQQPQQQQQQQLPRGAPEQLTLPALIQPPPQAPPAPQGPQAPGSAVGAGGAFGAVAAVTPPTLPTFFPTLPTFATMMPPAPPAMGTIFTQMSGNVHPIMIPGLGIVGYSNHPQPTQ